MVFDVGANMANKIILSDGAKSVSLTGTEGWTYFSNPPRQESDVYYARVAAAFRAYNLKANTVGNMPFALMKGDEVFDESSSWENKVGFLPNPSEWLRLATLSYMARNAIYNLMTTDALGYKARGLYSLTPYSCEPVVNTQNTQVDYIERTIGTQTERYSPDGKQIFPQGSQRLIYLWRLDHTTELLPSLNTEAQAIMNSAGVLHSADTWIRHFFERGGVSPFIIAMKGMIPSDKKEEEEKKWTDWYLGLRDRFRRIFKITNADSLDVKQVGQGVGDLKDNETYNQAIANVAMGTGMPLSLLLANSANYATAKEEKSTWYENDIIPLCNWLAYEYNRQVFAPLKLRLEFHPETLDPQQEDETERAAAINAFMDFLSKCPTYEVFLGTCETFGYELSESLIDAAEKYYIEKKENAAVVAQQTQGAPQGQEQPQETEPETEPEDDTEEEEPEDEQPAKWIPSIKELDEMRVWRKACVQRMKRSESLDFEYLPHYGGLPESITGEIKKRLTGVKSAEELDVVFDASKYTAEEKTTDPLIVLAQALNKVAEVEAKRSK